MKQAAVSIVQNAEGLYLVVWNKRYGGWGLPGGMVEEGETVGAAQRRELEEETGAITVFAVKVYECDVTGEPNRANHIIFFTVGISACTIGKRERGCPITFFTREELLKWSPFREWYSSALNAHNAFIEEKKRENSGVPS
jgi:ADP-ribose pyrophosphatase YjhB (NUDIX family)